MRVKENAVYVFDPSLWDLLDPKTSLVKGDVVRVKNMPGCPKANTMGHCHVVNPVTGQFIGLVSTESLTPVREKEEGTSSTRRSS